MSEKVMSARIHLEGLMELKAREVTGRDLAAAALLLSDGLAYLAYEMRRPATPEEAFGLREDDMAPAAGSGGAASGGQDASILE